MPKPTSGDFPMHVWRINSDPAYSTFPTQAEFEAAASAKKVIANMAADSKGYASAVWVDIDLACGQCHGGSAGAGAVKNGAPYWSKASLAVFAKAMHTVPTPTTPPPAIVPGASTFTLDGFAATYTDHATGGSGNLTVKVTWGDGKTSLVAPGSVTTHNYTRARTFNAKSTVFDMGVNGTKRQMLTSTTASLTVAPLSISGTVNDSAGNALKGVVVTLKQGTIARKRTVTRVDGSYLLNNVLPNASTTTSGTPYTLVPTKKNMTFPAGATFTVTNAPVSAATITAN
jgi:hypothetical protein